MIQIPIHDFIIANKTGQLLYYQQIDKTSSNTGNAELMTGIFNAMENLAELYSDCFDELVLKGMRVFFVQGIYSNCYIRVSREKKVNRGKLLLIFREILEQFEYNYQPQLKNNETGWELFDNFSELIKEKVGRDFPEKKVKSSELLKSLIGIEISKKKARRIIDQL
ncbi:MAG: hypothetical protein ACTSP4_05330 [Candidatus Hodarchaeales archaeon]